MNKCITYLLAAFILVGCGHAPEKVAANKPNKINVKKQVKDTIVDIALVCVDYAEMGNYDPEKESFKDYVKKRKRYLKGKTELTEDYVRNHLFGGLDSVVIANKWSGETIEKKSVNDYMSDSDFYLIGTILNQPLYKGILYEEIQDYNTTKFFSTIDKQGKFISRILIAEYGQTDTYLNDKGERRPYYTQINGCINKDFTINKDGMDGINVSENNEYYEIHPNGKIVGLIKR